MDEIDAADSTNINNTNLGVINGVYLIKEENEDFEEDISFQHNSSFPSIVFNSEGEIKKEVRHSEDDHIDVKEEPLGADEGDNSATSSFESAEIMEESHEHVGTCFKMSRRKTPQRIQVALSTRGQEEYGEAIGYCPTGRLLPEMPILPSDDTYGRLAHELLPRRSIGDLTSSPRADSSNETSEEEFNAFVEETTPNRLSSNSAISTNTQITAREKKFKCSLCSKGFSSYYHLRNHKRIHTGESPYKCSVCSRGFISSYQLCKHRQIHTGKLPYRCSECPREFVQLSNLKAHKLIHIGEQPHKCLCGKRFSGKSSLKRHERIHTVERPFECSFCLKRFRDKYYLKRHKFLHLSQICRPEI